MNKWKWKVKRVINRNTFTNTYNTNSDNNIKVL